MISETFCVNPWITLHAKTSEGFNPCCLFRSSINCNSVNEYINSDELKSIKSDLLNGKKITDCNACWNQEKLGLVSKRQRDNQTYSKIFQVLNQDLSNTHGNFVEYYLRLGNHCNLRCTTCNDQASSGWISENKKFNLPAGPVVSLDNNADVWDHLKTHASTIGAIEFVGGEPFMINSEQQVAVLKWLVDNNHARHIRLKYNTNGTRMPTEQLVFWKFFKAIEINVSVDGVKEQFEYLRFPAKWSDVDFNIKWYQQLQQTLPQLELTVITTVSILNIGYIDQILDYCATLKVKIFMNMLRRHDGHFHHGLEGPAILNLYNLDNRIKSWILTRIAHVTHPSITTILDNFSAIPGEVSGSMILNFLTKLDQRRGLDVRKTFPELVQCLESLT